MTKINEIIAKNNKNEVFFDDFFSKKIYQPPEPPLWLVPDELPPLDDELAGGMYVFVVCVDTKVSRLTVRRKEFGTS